MAKYQNKKRELSKSLFQQIFGDLSEETQIKLVETLSQIENVTRL